MITLNEWKAVVVLAACEAAAEETKETGHKIAASIRFDCPEDLPGVASAHVKFYCTECVWSTQKSVTVPMDIDGLIDN